MAAHYSIYPSLINPLNLGTLYRWVLHHRVEGMVTSPVILLDCGMLLNMLLIEEVDKT